MGLKSTEDMEILGFIKPRTGKSIGLSAIKPVVPMGHTVWPIPSGDITVGAQCCWQVYNNIYSGVCELFLWHILPEYRAQTFVTAGEQ